MQWRQVPSPPPTRALPGRCNAHAAVELFERAVLHGHWRAPYQLAVAYADGLGVDANCTKAAELFRAFFSERSRWGDQLVQAVEMLDDGERVGL